MPYSSKTVAPIAASPRSLMLACGAAIISARGIPGTLGFFAVTRHDRRLVMVTSHHVFFGAGAGEGEAVWSAFDRVGSVAYGRAGIVRSGDTDIWIDCAAAYVDPPVHASPGEETHSVAEPSPALAGMRVTKRGAATGTTRGVVADIHYTDVITAGVRKIATPEQILVRPIGRERFCAEGDSGAALRDERGTIVGLIWGCTPRGEGVACPIAPVLRVLNIDVL